MNEPLNFKDSVNLPKTDFPIRAGLLEREPQLLQFWNSEEIDTAFTLDALSSKQLFTLHDGPPYPNGAIHMGHALNKVLKDIINRFYYMNGYGTRFIPGWDCHGLPIETQVIKSLQGTADEPKRTDIPWFREQCKQFALDYVEEQKAEFKRLGIFADWDTPYLTLNPKYEAAVIRKFGELADNGLVYHGRKPIHWCMHCETALAEAEIEYADHRSPSVFVTFKVSAGTAAVAGFMSEDRPVSLLVWTTTPWTLPANVAVAAHPDFEYAVIQTDAELLICVSERASALIELLQLQNAEIIGRIKGKDLAQSMLSHPFLDRTVPVITADFVTNEDGTGFVHIAPGHGQDDYLVGQANQLPIIMPVNDQGCFTSDVEWAGMKVFDANKLIVQRMESLGTLKKLQFISHSYPHCWRCKNPVIFRATEQWFIGMDMPTTSDGQTLRTKALQAVRNTQWVPAWGQKRIEPMIANRPDWCVSRQRSWGIPIPVFKCRCGHTEMAGEFNKAVVDLVAKHGTTAWFENSADEILPNHLTCSKCGQRHFEKETDILDVWFESGASFASVIEQNDGVHYPADLYLEGSDQHRGWFQSSLLIGVGTSGHAPFKAVLTHGFIVDDKGKKMSKSLGNVVAPQDVIKEYGADVLRFWIAGSDFKDDVGVSKAILNQSRDAFSKVRNTIRFCLSNLDGFNPDTDLVDDADLTEVDRWAMLKLHQLISKVDELYRRYDFHLITHALHDFCAVTLSSLYLDMVKDRLYCDPVSSTTRLSTQTVIHRIASTLIRLIAPILPFTAEDAFGYFTMPNKPKSVHLLPFPHANAIYLDADLDAKWTQLLSIRDQVYQHLEVLRTQKTVRSFLEASVDLVLPEPIEFNDWPLFFIVSQVTVSSGAELKITVSPAVGQKCARCWKVLPLPEALCGRCKIAYSEKS